MFTFLVTWPVTYFAWTDLWACALDMSNWLIIHDWIFMRAAVVGPSVWPSPWLLMFQKCFLDVWRLAAWGSPSRFPSSDIPKTALPVRCRHGGKRPDWPSQTCIGQLWLIEKPRPARLEPLDRNWPPRGTFTDEETSRRRRGSTSPVWIVRRARDGDVFTHNILNAVGW